MNQLTEAQLKQKTKAQLIDGFLKLNRKVNKETQDCTSKIAELEQKCKQQQEKIEILETTTTNLEKELDISHNKIQDWTSKIAELEQKCKQQQEKIEILEATITNLEKELDVSHHTIEETNDEMDFTEESTGIDEQDSNTSTNSESTVALVNKTNDKCQEENSDEDYGDKSESVEEEEEDDNDEDDDEVKESDKYPSKTPLRLPTEITSFLKIKAADSLKTKNLTLDSISKLSFNINKSISVLMLGSFTKKYLKGHKRSGQGGKKGVLKRKPMEEQHLLLITNHLVKLWKDIPGATRQELERLINKGLTTFFNNFGKKCNKQKKTKL